MSGLKTLKERRSDLTDKFALKLRNNPRYSYLFPQRPLEQRRARRGNRYVEENARTSRLFNSPIYYMRRRLNVLDREGGGEEGGNIGGHGSVGRDGRNVEAQRCDFLFDEWR